MAIAFILCCIFVIQFLNGDRCCWDSGMNWEAIASGDYYSSLRRRYSIFLWRVLAVVNFKFCDFKIPKLRFICRF
ncbi:MAG: hypothetical protein RMZ69_02725 [Nostoc sp. ChiQUE01a]|nr:hypothetical protein [Nostoc sp. ChiQUE01a]